MEFVDLVMDRAYVPEEELILVTSWCHISNCESELAIEDRNFAVMPEHQPSAPNTEMVEEPSGEVTRSKNSSNAEISGLTEAKEGQPAPNKRSDQGPTTKLRRSTKKRTKNILINFGTGLRKFIKSRTNKKKVV